MAVLPRIAARLSTARVSTHALGVLSVAWLILAGLATPAQARVEKVLTKGGGPEVTVGVQPREGAFFWEAGAKHTGLNTVGATNPAVTSFGNAEGHEVVHVPAVNTYAIYWDPSDYYHGDWQGLIDGFLANLGESNGGLDSVFAVDGQYTDATNKPASTRSRFRGAYTDTHPYPEAGNCADPHAMNFGIPLLESGAKVCLTGTQVQAELERFIKQREEEHFALSRGMGTVFYLMTPPGVTVCLDEGGRTATARTSTGRHRKSRNTKKPKTTFPKSSKNTKKEEAKFEEEAKNTKRKRKLRKKIRN